MAQSDKVASNMIETLLQDRGSGKRKIKPNKELLASLLGQQEKAITAAGSRRKRTGSVASIRSPSVGGDGDDGDDDSADDDWGVKNNAQAKIDARAQSEGSSSSSSSGESESESDSDGSDASSAVPSDDGGLGDGIGQHQHQQQLSSGMAGGGTVTGIAAAAAAVRSGPQLCCICLEVETSYEGDFTQRCDDCGILVHGSCYGSDPPPEPTSTGDESDREDEPFFCEACKAQERSPVCAVCPTEGGAFKQAVLDDCWIHSLCTFYTDGIRWGDDETQSPVILEGVLPARWGARPCEYCDDPEDAASGVTIKCDAGMCKVRMHVTCAQRMGLLHDTSVTDPSAADPCYALCTKHVEKLYAKRSRQNYRKLMAQRKQWPAIAATDREHASQASCDADADAPGTASESEKQRIERKFVVSQNDFRSYRARWKATNAGEVAAARDHRVQVLKAISQKAEKAAAASMAHTTPELTVEFVEHYQSYPVRNAAVERRNRQAREEHVSLTETADELGVQIAQMKAAYAAGREESRMLRATAAALLHALESDASPLCNQVAVPALLLAPPAAKVRTTDPAPDGPPIKPSKASKVSGGGGSGSGARPSPKRKAAKAPSRAGKGKARATAATRPLPLPTRPTAGLANGARNGCRTPPPASAGVLSPLSPTFVVPKCRVCSMTSESFLMAKCDVCAQYCHIGCHDPPLKQLPKKSKYRLWQCVFCDESSSGSDAVPVIPQPEPGKRPQRNKRKRFMTNPDDRNLYYDSNDDEANLAFYASLDSGTAVTRPRGRGSPDGPGGGPGGGRGGGRGVGKSGGKSGGPRARDGANASAKDRGEASLGDTGRSSRRRGHQQMKVANTGDTDPEDDNCDSITVVD